MKKRILIIFTLISLILTTSSIAFATREDDIPRVFSTSFIPNETQLNEGDN